jgi:protein-disulfide isomerase
VFLLSVLLMDLAHLCLFCQVVQILNLCLFFALGKLCNSLAARPATRRPRLLTSAALVLGLAGQATPMLFGTASASFDAEAILADYLAAPEQEVPVDPGDPALGETDNALARLVVFSSFQCPACQRFGLQTRQIKDHFGDQVSIVFKHFPLSSECNPIVRSDLQPHACAISRAAEAARQQGRFWAFHDAFYAENLAGNEAALQSTAVSVGLDLDRWKVDREAKDTQDKIERDIELATELGVNYTPAIFLNGRRVPKVNLIGVALLIKHELDAALQTPR